MSKAKVYATVRLRVYPIVAEAVENACIAGVRRYWKHRDPPAEWTDENDGELADQVAEYVINALSEIFDWGD